MGLKPPAPQNLKKRLQFFMDHPEFPKARWEVFNCSQMIINKQWLAGKLNRIEYNKKMDDLDRTQGWTEHAVKKMKSDIKNMTDEEFVRSMQEADQ